MQNYENSRALKAKRLGRAMDLWSNSWGSRRPSRGRGPRVYGGPAFKREGARDPVHPSQITRLRSHACEARRRARRRQGRRGGASPEDRRRTLIRCTGRLFARAWALCVAGEHASTPRRSGRRRGHPQRLVPEGGGSASPVSPWSGYCAQGKEKWVGRLCSPREEEPGEHAGEGKGKFSFFLFFFKLISKQALNSNSNQNFF
jgi:hypothetical protein